MNVMKKTILFLNCDGAWFGSEKILYLTVKALAPHYHCHVILPYDGILAQKLRGLNVVLTIKSYPILRRKLFNPVGIITYVLGFIQSLIFFRTYVRTNDIDLIYSNTITVLEGFVLSKMQKKAHIWHLHEVIEKPAPLFMLLRWFLKNNHGLNLFVSRALLDKYALVENNQCRVIHNGIEPVMQGYTPRKRADCFTIGHIGTFNKQKGQRFFLAAVKYMLDTYELDRPLKVLMVGPVYGNDTRYREQVQKMIKENNLAQIVELQGFTEDIASVYACLDLFVSTSVLHDPFPTVVLEAMSASVPVLALNSGGVGEMLENNRECLIDDESYKTFADRLYYYYQDANRCRNTAVAHYATYKNRFAFIHFEKNITRIVGGYAHKVV